MKLINHRLEAFLFECRLPSPWLPNSLQYYLQSLPLGGVGGGHRERFRSESEAEEKRIWVLNEKMKSEKIKIQISISVSWPLIGKRDLYFIIFHCSLFILSSFFTYLLQSYSNNSTLRKKRRKRSTEYLLKSVIFLIFSKIIEICVKIN